MKKIIALLAFLLIVTISYSQIFKSEKENLINIDTKEIQFNIDNYTYKGIYQSFTSKKDKKEYLIYSNFSRSLVICLNTLLNKIENSTPNLGIDKLKLIHSNDTKSIIKAINKKGIDNLHNFICVYESSNNDMKLLNTSFSSAVKEID